VDSFGAALMSAGISKKTIEAGRLSAQLSNPADP
jgi:hypothetical protein